MRILALDLGQRTGWAYSDQRGRYDGRHDLMRFEAKERGARFVAFLDWLQYISPQFPPWDVVVYEQPHHRGGPSTRALVGMASILEMFCSKRGFDCFGVHTGTLKKHATGKGNTKGKAALIRRACELTSEDITDDNEADAVCLLDYAFSLEAIPRTAQ